MFSGGLFRFLTMNVAIQVATNPFQHLARHYDHVHVLSTKEKVLVLSGVGNVMRGLR